MAPVRAITLTAEGCMDELRVLRGDPSAGKWSIRTAVLVYRVHILPSFNEREGSHGHLKSDFAA